MDLYPVGPDGFVRPVAMMGDDALIVRAARVTAAHATPMNSDRGLIRYLMRHNHGTPFEMCQVVLHVRAPMDVWRQWVRHRTASINEVSTRYGAFEPVFAATAPGEWRMRAPNARQGSADAEGSYPYLSSIEEHAVFESVTGYKSILSEGVAPEMARKVLPLGTYTEAYWRMDLRNLLHFIELRAAPNAQQEIREYAEVISEIVRRWVPRTWEAFCDYRLNAVTLSAPEIRAMRGDTAALTPGELKEFEAKMERINGPEVY